MTESAPANPDTPEPAPPADTELSPDELIGHLEFGCWSAWVLIPCIYFLQGPSVSQDQFVMRCLLTAVAVIGAPALTLLRRRRSAKRLAEGQDEAARS